MVWLILNLELWQGRPVPMTAAAFYVWLTYSKYLSSARKNIPSNGSEISFALKVPYSN